MLEPRPHGRIKTVPDDFVVDEIPAYEPCGEGDHVFVRFTKRGKTTEQAVRALASALGADPRAAGVAGNKDKMAVTTQTASFLTPRGSDARDLEARACSVSLDGITVVGARRHQHKLRPGHLAGNRFAIRVRGLTRGTADQAAQGLEEAARAGVPNAFGPQRFGARGDNVERAREWLAGRAPPPRDLRLRRLLHSALQASVFNAVLEARVADGTWATPLEGDLLKRRTSGGLFLCADVQTDQLRAKQGEVSPTGPIFGVKMRAPSGAPAALETRVMSEILGPGFDFNATRALGEGSRRALRLWIDELRVDRQALPEEEDSLRVYFVLPKGSYATTVLGMVLTLEEATETTETIETSD